MKRTYESLYVSHLTDERMSRTCGYRYVVTDGAMAHTAFGCRRGLDLWLGERGLRLDSAIPNKGDSSRITGRYHTESHLSNLDAFDSAVRTGFVTRDMSNGDWVSAAITIDAETGERTVHTLNPNVRDRAVYDHAESRKLYGAGYCRD